MALTFNRVTDKKSSWILIYLNKDTDIKTKNGGATKTNWTGEFTKNVGILNKGGLFNKGVSEVIDKWRERGGSGSAETVFKV